MGEALDGRYFEQILKEPTTELRQAWLKRFANRATPSVRQQKWFVPVWSSAFKQEYKNNQKQLQIALFTAKTCLPYGKMGLQNRGLKLLASSIHIEKTE